MLWGENTPINTRLNVRKMETCRVGLFPGGWQMRVNPAFPLRQHRAVPMVVKAMMGMSPGCSQIS